MMNEKLNRFIHSIVTLSAFLLSRNDLRPIQAALPPGGYERTRCRWIFFHFS
jgi:hypothetical protein